MALGEFTYDGTHNVEIVSKSDYENCASSNAMKTYTGGKTTVTLKEGPTYFICGTPGHCAGGMKLQVNAKGSGSSPGTTPSTSTQGSSGSPTGLSHLTFGLPLALIAFMC
ncbi:Blue copper protein [Bienertia sinuspersici]